MKNIDLIFQRVAKANNMTVEEMRQAMDEAIAASFKSDKPEAREFWKDYPCKDTQPGAEEFLELFLKKYFPAHDYDIYASDYYTRQ